MTTEEKFNAAVNVIKSLPKNGSYQPSNDLMLRFYAYFKQATLGPCSGSRPPFYDVVGRAKYDAWKGLGDMSKERAMAKYVDELHTIVETMSLSDKVVNFLDVPESELETFNSIASDLEIFAGDIMQRVRSAENSPLASIEASREASPIRLQSSGELSPASSRSPMLDESDHSDDEYTDTIEFPELKKSELYNGHIPNKEHVSRSRTKSLSSDASQEIAKAVQTLRADFEKLSGSVTTLEKNIAVARTNRNLVGGIPLQFVIFIITWPFLASYIMNRFILNKK